MGSVGIAQARAVEIPTWNWTRNRGCATSPRDQAYGHAAVGLCCNEREYMVLWRVCVTIREHGPLQGMSYSGRELGPLEGLSNSGKELGPLEGLSYSGKENGPLKGLSYSGREHGPLLQCKQTDWYLTDL